MQAIPIIESVDRLLAASMDELQDFDWLCQHIASWGLQQSPGARYGEQWPPFVRDYGLWQQPEQLARMLLFVSKLEITSYCEIGIWQGYCLSLVTAYLSRFSKDLKAVGVDPKPSIRNEDCWDKVRDRLPIDVRVCTSADMKDERFDLVFVDGDHSYDSVRCDWENVGKNARVCAFHDCNCEFVERILGDNGSPKFWRDLRDSLTRPTVEFFDSPTGLSWMGIGVVLS